jgi:hypothetical protein
MRIRIKWGTGFRHNLCNLWLACNKPPAKGCPIAEQETLILLKFLIYPGTPEMLAAAAPDLF